MVQDAIERILGLLRYIDEGLDDVIFFEIYGVADVSDDDVVAAIRAGELSWSADVAAPAWLRDPSGYLVIAANRTSQRGELL